MGASLLNSPPFFMADSPVMNNLENIRIVLVNTSHPGNIGAVARAMKNMGLTQLFLVEPRDFPADQAKWRAANATDVLDSAKVVSNLDEAIADCELVIGTSARDRTIPWPLLNPREAGEMSVKEAVAHRVALLFGREDRGLTNEELQKCTYHVHIPANPDYSSLNLAAAVQVISYEIRMAWLEAESTRNNPEEGYWDIPLASSADIERCFKHMEEVLTDIGFYKPDNPKQTLTRLRRMFNRIRPDQMEMSIMRGILSGVQNLSNQVKRGK